MTVTYVRDAGGTDRVAGVEVLRTGKSLGIFSKRKQDF